MTILVKAVAGSHLFGTNTEKSDKDYKGIYLPSSTEILLGDYPASISQTTGDSKTKNNSSDIDVELYSYKKFLNMLSNGDTAALELLFTPDELIIEKSPEWDRVRDSVKPLINKNISAMIGYIRSQVNKYGVRGSRMSDLEIVIKGLKQLDKKYPHMKMKVCWEDVVNLVKDLKHCQIEVLSNGEDAINILGKKFGHHTRIEVVCKSLSEYLDEYGHRSKEAKENNGLDFKAISHALRVCIQAEELLTTGKITLPHLGETQEMIMKYKLGNVTFEEFNDELNNRLLRIEDLVKSSKLPENKDIGYMNLLLEQMHYRIVKRAEFY